VVLDNGRLVGMLTERDILRAVATGVTTDVVTVGPDWEVYEATAEMAARRIRHLVVTDGTAVHLCPSWRRR
jgi:CBS domain-containing protein